MRLSGRLKHQEWKLAGERLGLTVGDFSWKDVLRLWYNGFQLTGFVNGLEVYVFAGSGDVAHGPTMTWYRVGMSDDYQPPESSEDQVRREKMRLYGSPTVKKLWDAYPGAAVVNEAIFFAEKGVSGDGEKLVKTVNDLAGFVRDIRAES